MLQVVELQREIYAQFADHIRQFAAGAGWTTLLAVLPMGVVFGAVHALTPGHSKAVLATYVAGSPVGVARALLASLALSFTHVATAVLVVALDLGDERATRLRAYDQPSAGSPTNGSAPMADTDRVEYPEGFIAQVQLLWGEGFISPGGAEEVARIVEGVDLRDKEVLDIGTGLAGPACLLVEAHGAARVTGIDVQEAVLAKAAALVRGRGLAERILLRHVGSGPLPFADGSFDAVFSKETIVYVADKAALFREVCRVLRPGGWLLTSDWYPGDEEPEPPAAEFWRELAGVRAGLLPLAAQAAMLGAAGFVDVAATDRSAWYREASRRDARRMRTTDRPGLVVALGEEGAEALVERARVTAAMVGRGWLRPGHLRGRKPG